MAQFSRREFLTMVGGAIAAPLVGARASRPAQRLTESDPDARILGYVADAARTPPNDTNFTPGSSCANCALYQREWERDGFAPCLTFDNRRVPNTGWCRAYGLRTPSQG